MAEQPLSAGSPVEGMIPRAPVPDPRAGLVQAAMGT